MSRPDSPPDSQSPIALWDDEGPPRSRQHGDVYFSAHDGLGEARVVFLKGCGLPEAWAGRRRFVVGELGFGAGRNIAALIRLWRETREPGARLNIFSVENDLLTGAEAGRALAAWPQIADEAARLCALWPPRLRGFHRLDMADWGVSLDIAQFEAAEAVRAWDGAADAWFLDGFSPARDPALWREEVMAAVAARCAPGARLATYTVAGQVRRALEGAGFEVARAPGHGRKRQRLEARAPGSSSWTPPGPPIVVIGAGIAGVSLARALRAEGARVTLIEARHPGAGASGVPAALSAPRLDAGLGPIAALFAQAVRRAADLYDVLPGAVIARRCAHLAAGPKDDARFAAIAGSDLFAPGAARTVEASTFLDGASGPALALDTARVVDPAAILEAWSGEVLPGCAASLEPSTIGWRVMDPEGGLLAEAASVVLAAGIDSRELHPALPLQAVRGQAEFATLPEARPGLALNFGAWILPLKDGLAFGATHDRDDEGRDARGEDRARNLAALAPRIPALAARLSEVPLRSWVGIRAASPDYLPIVGPLAPGLFALTGLGGRGFVLAPLLGEHLAAQILGLPSPLPRGAAALMEPDRFARRAARRTGARNRLDT